MARDDGSFIPDIEHFRYVMDRNPMPTVISRVDDGVIGLDLEGRCTFVNPAAVETLGWAADELIGRVMHEVVHHSYADGSPYPVTECPAYHTLTEGMRCRVDDEVMWRRDGTAVPVEYTSQPIFEDGAVTGAVVMFHDISERRRAEKLLVAAHEEAERASRAK